MTKTQLPPDPEGMNDDRAGWAGHALVTFMVETGCDKEDAPSDLLCNLMHWCDRNAMPFDAQLARARDHYTAETTDETD